MDPSRTDPTLSVVVQVDLDARCVHLVVTGRLTERNHRSLTPFVARARTLLPGTTVAVDLTGARHVDPEGLDLLRWSVDHDPVAQPCGPVLVLTRPVLLGLPEEMRPEETRPEKIRPEEIRPAAARPAGPASRADSATGGVAA